SGIYLVPGAIQRQVGGSVGLAMLVWVAGGLLSLVGALTYGELAAMKPEAGGLYVYIRDCFGRLPAFLYGWTLFLVIATGGIATLAVAFSAYLSDIVPLTPFGAKLAAIAMIGVITVVNIYGTRESSDLQNWTTYVKIALILGMSGVLLWFGHGFHGSGNILWPERVNASLVSNFGLAMIAALWSYEGWQFASFSAGEAAHPQRDFPRAFFYGTLSLTIIYVIAAVSYVAALGPIEAGRSDTIAATAMAVILGPTAAKFVAILVMISTFSAANSIQLTAPRVYYAMAGDGLFFGKMAEVHPRFRTPAFAILIAGIWSSVLACLGSFQQLFTYVIFTGWIFYGLAGASIFVYRRRMPGATLPYRVPGYPWTPAVFVMATAALVVNAIFSRPTGAVAGLGVVLAGVPAYLIWRTRGSR
ncbi:MAG TPA: amino acid permease, partial [Candidatus Acidoferrales bacterium]|nr:amino acid permease [Candidatus Acidoferrales bacterium]